MWADGLLPGSRESSDRYIPVDNVCIRMVSKITILEPHFDGAQFGPASLGEAEPDEEEEVEAEGGSRARPLVAIGVLVLGVLAAVAARRRLGGVDTEEVSLSAPPVEE